jgi:hypothetical protein
MMISYHLVEVATDRPMGRSVAREVWVAAGLSADAVDIVLAKVPEGWAAHRSFESLSLEQIATLHLREGDARELAY